MHQGWPKFAASLWMATPDQGVVAVAYAPNVLRTTVRGGTRVRIAENTTYPFTGDISFVVDTSRPSRFPLRLRIPGWATGATISLNGKLQAGDVVAGTFYTVNRQWNKDDRVVLRFPLQVRASEWYHDSVTLERGALIFSLKIGEHWRRLDHGMSHPARLPAADWEVLPTTPWNYGLILDAANPGRRVRIVTRPLGQFPFSPEGTPVELIVKGRQIPGWKLVDGTAGPLPVSPVVSTEPVESLTLIPYGAAKLRITAFPRLAGEQAIAAGTSAPLR
jgi:hypothetical protein